GRLVVVRILDAERVADRRDDGREPVEQLVERAGRLHARRRVAAGLELRLLVEPVGFGRLALDALDAGHLGRRRILGGAGAALLGPLDQLARAVDQRAADAVQLDVG